MLVAQVNNAEPVPVWIFQHDEVRILRVAVPVDPASAERHQPRCLSLLFADVCDMKVKVQPRVRLRRRLAELEGNRRSGVIWRHEHRRPSAEPILAEHITQCR